MGIIITISFIVIVTVISVQLKNDRINLGVWETAHLSLP